MASRLHRRRRDTNLMYLRALDIAMRDPKAMSEFRNAIRGLMYRVAVEAGESKYYKNDSEKNRARLAEDLLEIELAAEKESEV